MLNKCGVMFCLNYTQILGGSEIGLRPFLCQEVYKNKDGTVKVENKDHLLATNQPANVPAMRALTVMMYLLSNERIISVVVDLEAI